MRGIFGTIATIGTLTLALGGTTYAQEAAGPGAGRWEVSAFPGGGIFFTQGNRDGASDFGEYALGASGTYNINRWIGAEGEIGGGIGIRQNLGFGGTSRPDTKPPHTLAYNGNVVYSFLGSDRALVPYATGGVGGLTVFSRSGTESLGVTSNETFFTGNVGGGIKWFATPHWGVRADYRFFAIKSKDDAPVFFGLNETRYGHRIYGGIIFTGGK